MKKAMATLLAIAILAIPAAGIAWDGFYLKKGYPIAATERALDMVIRMLQDQDYVAAQKIIEAGEAVITARPARVHIVKNHAFGHYEIRLPGSTVVFWAPKRAITLEKPEGLK